MLPGVPPRFCLKLSAMLPLTGRGARKAPLMCLLIAGLPLDYHWMTADHWMTAGWPLDGRWIAILVCQGFSTRTYESVAQGCVPLIIQDEPVSNTTVDQAFDEILPWSMFSLRLWQKDIPQLPQLLADFPDEKWRELRRNLACAWPRVLWLNADNEAPGIQTDDVRRAAATQQLGRQAYLSGYDAMESIMHTLGRRRARRMGRVPPPFEWRTPASSCKSIQGPSIASTGPLSAQPDETQ